MFDNAVLEGVLLILSKRIGPAGGVNPSPLALPCEPRLLDELELLALGDLDSCSPVK